jgi:hypothetical protein
MRHWSVQDAKVRLSELLRLARCGKPQHNGLSGGCVLIAEKIWSVVRGGRRSVPQSQADPRLRAS